MVNELRWDGNVVSVSIKLIRLTLLQHHLAHGGTSTSKRKLRRKTTIFLEKEITAKKRNNSNNKKKKDITKTATDVLIQIASNLKQSD